MNYWATLFIPRMPLTPVHNRSWCNMSAQGVADFAEAGAAHGHVQVAFSDEWTEDGAAVSSNLHHGPGASDSFAVQPGRQALGDRTAEFWSNYYEKILVRFMLDKVEGGASFYLLPVPCAHACHASCCGSYSSNCRALTRSCPLDCVCAGRGCADEES